ncbi:lipopolysaccharide biosynthesis protein [Parapedobacter deserti]|uniref:Lipopolysaccharide biosynthesis protein n=1 Tax=Parapedobacter deserti TaxID=1912957 RepID=A0ABV7JQ97_9SPHI
MIKHPGFAKASRWGKLISLTGGAQVLVQVFTMACGIMIVRLLPKEEYAYYTLANTMLGMMTVLADGGISSGTMAEGGKVWKDKTKLGIVLATGLDLRKRFAFGSLIIAIPILIFLLSQHGASALQCILIVAALVPAFFATLSDTIYQTALKLHQDIKPLQQNHFMVALQRLVFAALALLAWPWTFVALLANGIPRILGNIRLRKLSSNLADQNQYSDNAVRSSILNVVRRVLPASVYYCISGQVTIWLISIFGNTDALASFGALGRISASFAIVTTVFGTLAVPRFAKLPDTKKVLLTYFAGSQLILFLTSLFIISLVYLLSDPILFVLGPEYQGLNAELLLISISGCITIIGQATNSLMASKGLIVPPALFISTTVFVQVGAAFIFPISEIKGVILYAITTTATIYGLRLLYFYHVIKKTKHA